MRTLWIFTWILTLVHGEQYNILQIIMDDMRPELPVYRGTDFLSEVEGIGIKSPHIDELSSKSTVFTRAYCQYPLCSPSRSSFLTGRRPFDSQFYEDFEYFRKDHRDLVTLPEFFMNNGYASLGTGKVFHPARREGRLSFDEFHEFNSSLHDEYVDVGDTWKPVSNDRSSRMSLPDEDIRDRGVEFLQKFANGTYGDDKKNFYLVVGFMKPHIPWVAPQRHFDMNPLDKIRLADNRDPPKNCPLITWPHSTSCILEHANEASKKRISGLFNLTVPDDLAAKYRRGYFSCISYIDEMIGDVLAELKRLDLDKNTVIVLHSDHGYSLGGNSNWCKKTQFDMANHVPFMVHLPGQNSKKMSDEFVELVDLLPSLPELAGFKKGTVPHCDDAKDKNLCHEGASIAPYLTGDKDAVSKEAAFFTQFHHTNEPHKGNYLGKSVVTRDGRYTRWYKKPGSSIHVSHVVEEELYDHRNDRMETENVAGNKKFRELQKELGDLLGDPKRYRVKVRT